MSLNKETPAQYFYRCHSCKLEFDSERIEKEGHYLCPDCGTANDNEPLHGVLNVIYDLDYLRKNLSRTRFLELRLGCPWLYPELWPLDYSYKKFNQQMFDKLILPANMLYSLDYKGDQLYVLDDTRNPTYSYKDRASIIVALKAIQMGYSDVSVASTGNAGSSLAGICARLGLNAHIWVPEQIPEQKLLQIQAYGAQVHVVKDSYDAAFDLNKKIAVSQNWYDRNTAYNPLTIEGKKSAAYDIFISTKANLPDNIIIPVGDGVIIGGIFKGFLELVELGWIERVPRLIGVQASGSNALERYIQSGKFEFREARTIADSICAGAPRNLYMASSAIRESEGLVLSVEDELILNAQRECATDLGFLIEPSAASSLAAYARLKKENIITENQKSLLLFTGNGLKDIQAVKSWSEPVQARSVDDWKTIYEL